MRRIFDYLFTLAVDHTDATVALAAGVVALATFGDSAAFLAVGVVYGARRGSE